MLCAVNYLYIINMTFEQITKGSRRQAVWIDSLIHAREWLAGATNMRILDKVNICSNQGHIHRIQITYI